MLFRSRSKGTGLGLPIVNGYVKKHSGALRIHSEAGKGTSIKLYLPLHADAALRHSAIDSMRNELMTQISLLDPASERIKHARQVVEKAAKLCEAHMAVLLLADGEHITAPVRINFETEKFERTPGSLFEKMLFEPSGYLEVNDATKDIRLTPWGTDLLTNIKFFAGVPLHIRDVAVGLLCVGDTSPKFLNDSQRSGIVDLGRTLDKIFDDMDITLDKIFHVHIENSVAEQDAIPILPDRVQPEKWRVLVVDDETRLASVTVKLLTMIGCEAEAVYSPDAALERMRDGNFNALFSDIVMPGPMDGVALAKTLKEMNPELKIVLASGYSANTMGDIQMLGSFVRKPYDLDDLRALFN